MALAQAHALAKQVRVTLISDAFPPDLSLDHVRVAMPDLRRLRRFRHVFDELAFVRGARRALRSLHGVDFILTHAHAVAYLAARGRGVPVGMVVHGDIFERPPGTYDARLTAFYKWVTPRADRSVDLVIALARPFAELARNRGARRVAIIPNGIDPASFGAPPDEVRPRHTPFRILNVGRFGVEKGLGDLIDACGRLDLDHELTLAGGGPLEAELRKRGGDRVRFVPPQPRAMLGAVYAAHDVFCSSSLSEPFGTVLLEALVSGLPVIATAVGGTPEIVEDGLNGLLVPPRDPAAMANAIRRLAADEDLRQRLAANARGSVLPRLSWENTAERILDAIDGTTREATRDAARTMRA